jgi:hypothetical protein
MNPSTIIFSGSLFADPAPGGTDKAVCSFTLSFSGPYGSDQGAAPGRRDFVSVVTFGASAETCLRTLKRGSRIVVDGRLRQNRYAKALRLLVLSYSELLVWAERLKSKVRGMLHQEKGALVADEEREVG